MRLNLGKASSGVLLPAMVAVGLLASVVGCGSVAPTVTPVEGSLESTEVGGTHASSENGAVQSERVSITFGRAILKPEGRVTLFYVAKDLSGKSKGALVIDSATITDSDARSWMADGFGDLLNHSPLTLGWLTFPVAEPAPGHLRVTVNSVQTGDGPVTEGWQSEQFRGLIIGSDMSETVVVNSGMCVSSDGVALGFDEQACDKEFVGPHALRQNETTVTATHVVSQPTPTPTGLSTLLPPTPAPQEGKLLNIKKPLLFTLCTPWHFQLQVIIENVAEPDLTSSAPSTSSRCLLP